MVLCLPIAIGMADRQRSAIRLPADKSGRDLQKKTISNDGLFYFDDVYGPVSPDSYRDGG
jgi:hypothetical protein